MQRLQKSHKWNVRSRRFCYADGCAFFCFSQREYRFKQSVETTNPNVSPALSKKFGLQSLGGEGETRTLAPVTRPTPLAGAPRHQLEYFSIGSVFSLIELYIQSGLLQILMAERVGFEPTVPGGYDGFQDRSVMTTSVSLRKVQNVCYHTLAFLSIFIVIIIYWGLGAGHTGLISNSKWLITD